ncbi:MAG: GNAT family N-acetyltransferase [Thermoguttaceae bacterium]
MTYTISPVEWESRFFGFPIGKMKIPSGFSPELLSETLQKSQDQYRLIGIHLQDEGPDELETWQMSSPCYTRLITLEKPVPRNVVHLDSHVRAFTSNVCARDLERLAIQSGSLTRYKRDPELSVHFERLFLSWVNHAVIRQTTGSVWTWLENDEHIGLVTIQSLMKTHPNSNESYQEGQIRLLAVDEQYRRRGIGTLLFDACDFWCSSLDIPIVSITTQRENTATLALTQRIGFKPVSNESIYHYWTPKWIYDFHKGWICQKNSGN